MFLESRSVSDKGKYTIKGCKLEGQVSSGVSIRNCTANAEEKLE